MLSRPLWSVLFLLLESTWTSATPDDSFLSDHLIREGQVKNVLEHQVVKHATCDHTPTGPIETTLCDYETIESVSDDLYANLHDLVQTPFFKYFQVDIYRECPFWEDNALCESKESCALTYVDESEIPERWRAAALSKVELPPVDQRTQLPGCYYRDSDFCFLDDLTEGEYFDLTENEEHYTGYSGPPANRIWSAIYEENCFGLSEYNLLKGAANPETLPETMAEVLKEDGVDDTAACMEKRVYYKIISGLHASISVHICYGHLNATTGERGPNLPCFVSRIASHPERLQYIYFNTVLLLRAVARIGPYLNAYDYCSSGTVSDDEYTKAKLGRVIEIANEVGKFDESVLFRGENANILKEEFKDHFRNVSRIMDCIGCDRCRLWGKVQTTGVAVALKILFELDEKALDPQANSNLLSRSEVVALLNTLHRFSESLEDVDVFRKMWANTSAAESAQLIRDAEAATRAKPSPLASAEVLEGGGKGFLDDVQHRFEGLLLVCQRGTKSCLDVLFGAWERALRALGSMYRPGKGGGLYGEL